MNIPRALSSSCVGLFGLALVLLLPRLAAAAWPTDPQVNVPLCTAIRDQSAPMIVTDGAGGAIVTWSDYRSGNWDIYAQHVLASGAVDPGWPADGRALCTTSSGIDEPEPTITTDGVGGAIVAWRDNRSAQIIYAQHVLASGAVDPAWPADGRALCLALYNPNQPTIAADGAGGAIVAWYCQFDFVDIYAQHVLASGVVDPAWPSNGRALCTAADWQEEPKIVADGAGGAIVTWQDRRNWTGNGYDIYAQRVAADGKPRWEPNGLAVCTAPRDQVNPVILADGAGGAIISWGFLPQAQHVLASGVVDPAWPADGRALCPPNGFANPAPAIAADGAGGAIATWYDGRAGFNDLYAQHVLASGVVDPAWPPDGRALCPHGFATKAPTIATDGAGGAIVTWRDIRSGPNSDIYAQHVLASGSADPAWPINGRALCTASNTQGGPTIVTDAAGGAIVTWWDYRSGTNYDIYAQRVLANGQLGGDIPTATLVSLVAADVHESTVRLRWYLSLDEPVTLTVYRSTVAEAWRVLGTVTRDGSGYVNYEDAGVAAGVRYRYLLGLRSADSVERFEGEAWVDVPLASAGLAVHVPNPVVGGEVTVSFTAPGGRWVRVSLLDLAGRVVASRLVAGGSGRQSVGLAPSNDLAPGVYLVRIDLARPVIARVAVIR